MLDVASDLRPGAGRGGVAAVSYEGVFAMGEWAVMGNDGIVHHAATSGGLPSSGARCGAVGTAFIVSAPHWRAGRVCERCLALGPAKS
jgi:hypothetical protein